jgi:hypothetical protein
MALRSVAVLALCIAVLGLSSQAHAGNLVVNGSFETGDFTGWTQFGNTSFIGVTGNFGGVAPADGDFQAYFGPPGSIGGIFQTLATTVGATYDISFDLYNFGGTPSEYMVQFGSTTLVDVVNSPAFGYTTFEYTAVATSADTGFTAFGFQQNLAYFLLDDVVVTLAVPEPSSLISGSIAVLIGIGCALRRRGLKATD